MTYFSPRAFAAAAFLAAATLLAPSAPAHAAGNVGSGLIGNTVVLTGPAGTTQIFYRDRDNLIIKMADGKTRRGWWRVKGRSLCTRTGDAPENCTPAVDVPPVVGSSGTIDTPDGTGSIAWEVREGRAF
ncbi:MAG: hypothetical protein Q7S99_17525 [Parvibaculum sp.]|nr:hypothetical protein [Parvibaculum sp.]|tara:strand:+ start:776 stop:1162 length:387 start_codon:yes stop_codon:yes gene_type:complete